LLPVALVVAPRRARPVACQRALAARFPAGNLDGLTPATRAAFEAARAEALWRHGELIGLASGYRDAHAQARLFADRVRRTGSLKAAMKWTLPPHESRHMAGLPWTCGRPGAPGGWSGGRGRRPAGRRSPAEPRTRRCNRRSLVAATRRHVQVILNARAGHVDDVHVHGGHERAREQHQQSQRRVCWYRRGGRRSHSRSLRGEERRAVPSREQAWRRPSGLRGWLGTQVAYGPVVRATQLQLLSFAGCDALRFR
jgi:hypothetical protein